MLLIGTDGIWESRNPVKAVFGKQRLQQILREQHTRSAREIITAIVDALADFRQGAPQEDDVTLVIVKADNGIPVLPTGCAGPSDEGVEKLPRGR